MEQSEHKFRDEFVPHLLFILMIAGLFRRRRK